MGIDVWEGIFFPNVAGANSTSLTYYEQFSTSLSATFEWPAITTTPVTITPSIGANVIFNGVELQKLQLVLPHQILY